MRQWLKISVGVVVAVAATIFAATAAPARAETIKLEKANTFVIRGEVTSSSMNKLSHQILESKADKIYLFINSPGGSIFAGLKFMEAVKATDKKVICVADTAISMAFAILQGICSERLIMENAVLMQHVAAYNLQGQEPNNYTFSRFLHSMALSLYANQAKRMGMAYADFYSKIRDDWWMWGEEAVQANAADRVVNVKCSKDMLSSYSVEKIQVFIFTVELKFSSCPLISGPAGVNAPEEAFKMPGFGKALQDALDSYSPKSLVEKGLTSKPPYTFDKP